MWCAPAHRYTESFPAVFHRVPQLAKKFAYVYDGKGDHQLTPLFFSFPLVAAAAEQIDTTAVSDHVEHARFEEKSAILFEKFSYSFCRHNSHPRQCALSAVINTTLMHVNRPAPTAMYR